MDRRLRRPSSSASPSPRSCFRRITAGSWSCRRRAPNRPRRWRTSLEQVHLTAADRRAVNRTLVAFVRSGVTRDDPAAAWDLATPAMRSSGTRKQWNAGELPVLPYPAQISDHPTWNVLTAFPGDVTIDLLLQPRRTSKRGPIAFAVELKRKERGGRWLVDSMIPEQGFAPSEPEKVEAARRRAEWCAAEGEAEPPVVHRSRDAARAHRARAGPLPAQLVAPQPGDRTSLSRRTGPVERSLRLCGAEDPSRHREARSRRTRPRREDHRARAPRRRHGGDLHRPPPDARADRRDGGAGGRRRGRHLDPVRRAHDARPEDPRRPARQRRRGRARRRRRHDSDRRRRGVEDAGRRRGLHARRADDGDRRVPARPGPRVRSESSAKAPSRPSWSTGPTR